MTFDNQIVVRLLIRPNLVTFQVHIEMSVQQVKHYKDFPKNWNSFHKGKRKIESELQMHFVCIKKLFTYEILKYNVEY